MNYYLIAKATPLHKIKLKKAFNLFFLNRFWLSILLMTFFCQQNFSKEIACQSPNSINSNQFAVPSLLGTEIIKEKGSPVIFDRKISNSRTNTFVDKAVSELIITNDNHQQTFQLFSHGQPGMLLLEGKWRNAAEITDWLHRGNYLMGKTHLNIYGCNFAQGEKGRAAVKSLESALGISISASDDITGIDGDWDLEVGRHISNITLSGYNYNLASGYSTGCGEFANGFTTTTIDATGRKAWSENISGTQYEISFNSSLNRWEIKQGSSIRYYNTTTSTPNPPCVGNGTWVIEDAPCALTSVEIDDSCCTSSCSNGTSSGTCTGNADVVTSSTGVTNPNNAIGANSVTTATIDDGNLVLDLTDVLDAGATITITYQRISSSGTMTLEESTDGTTFSNSQNMANNFSQTATNFTLTGATRYIRISSTGFNVEVAMVAYSSQSCSGGSGSGSTCTYRDEFNSVSYSNSNGTETWTTNWIETGDANGPTSNASCFQSGYVLSIPQSGQCYNTLCTSGNCLVVHTITDGSGDYISRTADLSSATTATITYDYRTEFFSSSAVQFQIRTGAGSWNTLATYNVSSPISGSASINIDSYLASDSEVRFIVTGTQGGGIGIDNFKITFDCPTSNASNYPPADYTIGNGGTVNTCLGVFADSGDTNSDYGDGESHTMTFCSDENNHISFTFEHFNTEASNDVLSVYDGNSTGATKIGDYSGAGLSNSPGVVTSSGTCLTFQFVSNGSTTSNGWLARISCTGAPAVSVTPPSWTGYPTSSACSATSQIGGTVYEDIDNDGTQDSREPGIFGTTVTLYDDNGQVGSPVTTDANGEYTFSSLTASTVYRVEFTVPDNFTEGPYGTNSGTAVQFIESGRCDANLGLADAAHYCDNTDPQFVIPCYANGDPQHASNTGSTGVARFQYSDSGDSPTSTYTNYVTIDAIGTTWGVAWDGTTDRLYMSSLLKRHAGLGPNGIGAIYLHNDGDANTAASVFYDFGSAAGTVDDNATRFPGSGSAFGQEGPCGACDNIDPTTFAQVGKVGFGDIDINEANSKLYVSNLYDRKIYTIDIDNPTAGSATPLPGIPWLDNSPCSNGVARPWALEFRRGKLYVGVVCDASLSSCTPGAACSDLTAEIYSFDGTTWSNELSFALDYYRKVYATGSDYFVKWIDDWNTMEPYVGNKTDAGFAQPVIMDLEFDDDNSIIIGIGDRTGYQLGYQAPNPTANSDDTSERNMAFGDILRASYDNATGNFTLENNGVAGSLTTTNPASNSGPGGKSFYWGDFWTGIGGEKYQGGLGSLMLLPNSGEVATPLADAVSYYSNGITWMNNTDGSDVKRLEVYQGVSDGNAANFAKSAGVGDMVLLCESRPIEIGNIVWWDEDLDGLQDPSEPGISGVTIELWTDPNGNTQGNNAVDGDEVKVASTTTDTYGRYIFSYDGNANGLSAEDWSFTAADKVLPNTYYNIRIPNWATDAGVVAYRNSLGYTEHIMSPTQNQAGTDGAGGTQRDNNSYDNPGNAAIALQTGDYGDNDHNFDFAFGGVGGCDAPAVIPTANTPCDGETLNLMAAVSGGTSPYTYNWSGPNSFTSTTQNPSIASVDSTLNSGIYALTVTDNLGCVDTTHIHIAINKMSISTAATAASCSVSDGEIDLTVDVGVAAFTYNWSNSETTEDITGLAAGNYTVTVTDADGCTATATEAVGSAGSVTLAETHVDETCTAGNGSIDLTITGTPTTITWSTGATSEDLTGLSAGTYSVTVNNAGGCEATLSITLTDTPGPSVSLTQVNTTCGNSTGSIDLTVNGGTAPYTYDWDNDGTGDSDDAQDISGLAAGTYNVTVTDATGCTATTNATITDTPGPSLGAVPSNETCGNANGSIALTVMNGTGPFTYLWSNGLTTEDISGLGAGTFNVTVTDANGCTETTNATVTNTAGPTLSVSPTNSVDCNTDDGSINLTVTGGTAGYTYDWDNDGYEAVDNDTEDLSGLASGSYIVIVTDANGCEATISTSISNTNDPVLSTMVTEPTTCSETGSIDLTVTGTNSPYTFDWSNDGLGEGGDTEDLSGLAGGVYTVIVTGSDGCSSQANASILVIRAPIITETIVQPTCGNSDGSITLAIEDQDGSGPYTYNWSNGATTQNLTGLATGNYTVTLTNGIACTITATYSLVPTTAPSLTLISTNPTCGGTDGAINMTITGGTSPYQIDWDNNGTGDTNDPEDLTNLSAGVYNVTVSDNGGCQATGSVELISSEAPVLNALISNTNCPANDGSIDVTVTGVGPFTYDWSDNSLDGTEDPTGLSAGNYSLTVTDANGCMGNATFTINAYFPPATAYAIQPSCIDNNAGDDGYLQISVTTGDRYHYSIGSTFNDNGGADIYTNATVLGTLPDTTLHNLPNPTGSQDYTIRVYNGSNDCFSDVVVTMNEQDCTVGCDCNEMVYLNDPGHGLVHKFEIQGDGSFSEIGSPWFPAGGGLPSPHGLAIDLNGAVYIGETANGDVRKLSCDGTLFDEADYVINKGGFNFDSKDGKLYRIETPLPNDGDARIVEHDLCTGAQTGFITLNMNPSDPNGGSGSGAPYAWGFQILDDGTFAASSGWGDYGGANLSPDEDVIWYFSPTAADFTNNTSYNPVITQSSFPAPSNTLNALDVWGVTGDGTHIYVLVKDYGRSPRAVCLFKFTTAGAFVSELCHEEGVDYNGTAAANGGFYDGQGIIYNATTNNIYIAGGPDADCIAIVNASTMQYTGTAAAHVPGQNPKGIGMVQECCPTNNNITIDTTLCAAAINDTIFLQNLINCEGTICEGVWQAGGSNTGLTYNVCNNSVTIDAAVACGNFTLESDGTGNDPKCGAFKITINIEVEDISTNTISSDQTICLGTTAATLTSATTSSSGTLTYQWQESTTDCTTGFANIGGANSATYSPGVLTQATYYRLISSVDGSCSSGSCADTSNCVTISVLDFTAPTMGSDQTVCAGGDPAAITASSPSSGNGTFVSQYWQSSTTDCSTGFADISGATGGMYDPPSGITQTTYYRKIETRTLNGVQCNDTTNCVTISVLDFTAPTMGSDQTVCAGGDPAAITASSPSSGNGTFDSQYWQSSTTSCSAGFTDIAGATGGTYDPPAGITQTTYYRKIETRTLNGVQCNDTTNCVTVTVNPSPTLAATSSNPTTCSGTDGSISLTLTNVPDGTYTINYMDGVPSAQTFTNVTVSGGSATISGLSAGTYNDLTITASGCTSTENVDIVLTDPTGPNILGRDTSLCRGSTLNLAALITGTPIGRVEYGTTFGNYPDTITTSISLSTTATYYIRDSISAACVDTAQIIITVLDTFQTITADTICTGEPYTFNGQTLSATGTYRDTLLASNGCDSFLVLNFVVQACDWGDLPDTSATTNASDYQTTSANNGPVHVITAGLNLGSTVDGETDGQPSNDALGDDVDEDGLTIFNTLNIVPGGILRLPLDYTNTTGNPAYIEAWIDWNNNGEFDAGEMVLDVVDPSSGLYDSLEVSVPTDAVVGAYLGLRIRISNEDNMTPYGKIGSGEIEDYLIGLECKTQICVPFQTTVIRKE